MDKKEKKGLRKTDLYIIAGALILAFVSYMFVNFMLMKKGSVAIIKVDGKIVKELMLDEDTEYTVNGYNGGKNTVEIRNGEISMKDADCPDELCVKTGKISKEGETIVCLPHRVVIEIEKNNSKDSYEYDGIVR